MKQDVDQDRMWAQNMITTYKNTAILQSTCCWPFYNAQCKTLMYLKHKKDTSIAVSATVNLCKHLEATPLNASSVGASHNLYHVMCQRNRALLEGYLHPK